MTQATDNAAAFATTRDQWSTQWRNSRTNAVLTECETALATLHQIRRDGFDLPCEMADVVRHAGVKLALIEGGDVERNPLAAGAFCPQCGTRLDKAERPCPFGCGTGDAA